MQSIYSVLAYLDPRRWSQKVYPLNPVILLILHHMHQPLKWKTLAKKVAKKEPIGSSQRGARGARGAGVIKGSQSTFIFYELIWMIGAMSWIGFAWDVVTWFVGVVAGSLRSGSLRSGSLEARCTAYSCLGAANWSTRSLCGVSSGTFLALPVATATQCRTRRGRRWLEPGGAQFHRFLPCSLCGWSAWSPGAIGTQFETWFARCGFDRTASSMRRVLQELVLPRTGATRAFSFSEQRRRRSWCGLIGLACDCLTCLHWMVIVRVAFNFFF